MGMGDTDYAKRFYETVKTIVKSVLATERPDYRYGIVTALDRGNRLCSVQFTGESGSQENIRMSTVQPGQIGQLVRVCGKAGDYYVEQTLGASSAVFANYLYAAPWSATQGGVLFLGGQPNSSYYDWAIWANGGWLEFYNPNIGSGADCFWIASRTDGRTKPIAYVPGQIRVGSGTAHGMDRESWGKSGNQSISSGAWTDLSWDTAIQVNQDDGTILEAGQVWWDMVLGGTWNFTVTIHTSAFSTGYLVLRLVQFQGSKKLAQSPPFSGASLLPPSLTLTWTGYLPVGSNVKAQVLQSAGSSISVLADGAQATGETTGTVGSSRMDACLVT